MHFYQFSTSFVAGPASLPCTVRSNNECYFLENNECVLSILHLPLRNIALDPWSRKEQTKGVHHSYIYVSSLGMHVCVDPHAPKPNISSSQCHHTIKTAWCRLSTKDIVQDSVIRPLPETPLHLRACVSSKNSIIGFPLIALIKRWVLVRR